MNPIPTRLRVFGATGVLVAGLGAAALSGAFAAPAPTTFAASTTATPTATASGSSAAAGGSTTGTSPSTTAPAPNGARPGPRGFGPGFAGSSLSSLASYLGMSTTDLQTALRNGQTLAQIAQAHGKSTADLKTFLTNQLKAHLDQQVASGKLTSQQETTILSNASSRIDQAINRTLPSGPRGRGPGGFGLGPGGSLIQTVAQTLGVNASDVQSELHSGKTLAQIAQEHGKTATDLENALINAYKARLDQLMNQTFPSSPTRPAATASPTPTP